MNKLVNGKFTAPACGLINRGVERMTRMTATAILYVCVSVFRGVCAMRMRRGM